MNPYFPIGPRRRKNEEGERMHRSPSVCVVIKVNTKEIRRWSPTLLPPFDAGHLGGDNECTAQMWSNEAQQAAAGWLA